jgi:6-phosphogluconate dehydrogenase
MKFDDSYSDVRVGGGKFVYVRQAQDNVVLCDLVIALCEERGCKLWKVAQACGISQTSLSKAMHARFVGEAVKERLCACFCVPQEVLFP